MKYQPFGSHAIEIKMRSLRFKSPPSTARYDTTSLNEIEMTSTAMPRPKKNIFVEYKFETIFIYIFFKYSKIITNGVWIKFTNLNLSSYQAKQYRLKNDPKIGKGLCNSIFICPAKFAPKNKKMNIVQDVRTHFNILQFNDLRGNRQHSNKN